MDKLRGKYLEFYFELKVFLFLSGADRMKTMKLKIFLSSTRHGVDFNSFSFITFFDCKIVVSLILRGNKRKLIKC